MQLKEYLKKEGISVPKFARRLGLHYNTIYMWFKRERDPTRENAQAVSDATRGEVTVEDMLHIKEPRKICPCCGRKIYNTKLKDKPTPDKDSTEYFMSHMTNEEFTEKTKGMKVMPQEFNTIKREKHVLD